MNFIFKAPLPPFFSSTRERRFLQTQYSRRCPAAWESCLQERRHFFKVIQNETGGVCENSGVVGLTGAKKTSEQRDTRGWGGGAQREGWSNWQPHQEHRRLARALAGRAQPQPRPRSEARLQRLEVRAPAVPRVGPCKPRGFWHIRTAVAAGQRGYSCWTRRRRWEVLRRSLR